MSDAVTLYDNGSTVFTLRARTPRAARLVVTFSCMNSNNVDEPGWGEDFLWAEGFDVMSVKARENRWYQDVSLSDFSSRLSDHLSYEETFTYGTSMGAYAAAYFAAAIKPKKAILFSPQYSIDPAISDWDERWKDFRSLSFTHVPLRRALSQKTEYVIVYDPSSADGRHASDITAAVGPENVSAIKIPLSGHEAITTIYEVGVLPAFILAQLRGSADLPEILRSLPKKSRETWTYAYHLFFRALSQRRRIANKALAMEVFGRAKRLSHQILSLEPLLAVQAWDEAAAVMTGLDEIKPGVDLWVDGAVASVNASLRRIPDPQARSASWINLEAYHGSGRAEGLGVPDGIRKRRCG